MTGRDVALNLTLWLGVAFGYLVGRWRGLGVGRRDKKTRRD